MHGNDILITKHMLHMVWKQQILNKVNLLKIVQVPLFLYQP